MDKSHGQKSGRARVLVVEDSPTQLEELRFVLEDAGLEVVVATNGREGLEAARTNAVDLVITDVVMPEMDGYELCKALRGDDKLRRLPVMLLTSLSDPLDVIRGLESGADNFLRKPFEAECLLARVRNVLGTAQLRKTAGSEAGLTVRFRDKDYYLGQERLQLLDALLSAFDDALCVAPSMPDRPIEGTRVLVVEDSPTEAERLRFLLEKCGCSVVTAVNGREGLEAFLANPTDLVISDVVMPEMDGYELCRAIRADESRGDVPVVLVSALADPQDLIAGLEAGANNFVRKPFNDRHISVRIGNLLAGREARRANGGEPAIDILYEGQRFSINAERAQILDLLLSSYDGAVQQNIELARTQDELQTLTQRLEVRVAERTAALRGEIEQRKLSEERAAQVAREWQQTFDTSASAIWVLDAESRVLRANKTTERLFDHPADESSGKYCWQIAHGTECAIPECPNARARESLSHETAELRRGDLWLEVVVDPVLDGAGRYAGAVHVVTDVTARKEAEQSLRLTQFSVDHAADLIVWSDFDGRLVGVNDSACRSLGYRRDELLAMNMFDLDVSASEGEWSRRRETIKVEGTLAFESFYRAKDGRTVPVDVVVSHVTFEDQELNCAFARDITTQRLAQEALRESEQRYHTLFDTMLEGFAYCRMLYDDEGRPEDWVFLATNKAFLNITGLADVVGKRVTEVLPTIRETSPEVLEVYGRVALTGDPETFEIDFIPLSMFLHMAVTSPAKGEFIAVFTDETARRSTGEQLRQSQKMEAIGQLAGGIAHDFNNLLTAILGYSELLLSRQDMADSTAREDVEEIKRAAERAGALTRQILAFSRRQAMCPSVVSLNEVLAGMEPLLRRTLGEDIDLVSQGTPDLAQVEADVNQFEQVILNLAVNARDAMREGGRLTLETANVELDEEYCQMHPEVTPGHYVMLSVSDTGMGMDESVRKRVFEPFFTTKAPGEGTGLGLATAYGIVKQSGGNIFVYSEPGQGTSFKIYLPRVSAARVPNSESDADLVVSTRGDETILVLEDEAAIRDLIVRILGGLGYTVLVAGAGEEALQVLADANDDVDLLITDLVLPGGIQGKEMADMVQSSRPDLPVLFMSGYTRNAIVHAGRLDEGVNFLGKPFTPDALARMVRTLLDR